MSTVPKARIFPAVYTREMRSWGARGTASEETSLIIFPHSEHGKPEVLHLWAGEGGNGILLEKVHWGHEQKFQKKIKKPGVEWSDRIWQAA